MDEFDAAGLIPASLIHWELTGKNRDRSRVRGPRSAVEGRCVGSAPTPAWDLGLRRLRHLDGADHQTAAREEQQRERVEPFAEDHVVPAPEVRPGESEVE